jgi:hypothetical protein
MRAGFGGLSDPEQLGVCSRSNSGGESLIFTIFTNYFAARISKGRCYFFVSWYPPSPWFFGIMGLGVHYHADL